MKNTVIAAVLILSALTASAQIPQRPVLQRPGLTPKADRKAEFIAEPGTEPDAAPSEELNVEEFLLRRNELKGQVVELTFDKVVSLKQAGNDGYVAIVTYESPRIAEGLSILVPQDGLELFEELSRRNTRSRQQIYVQVLSPSAVKAIGTRYNKNKDAGERYSW